MTFKRFIVALCALTSCVVFLSEDSETLTVAPPESTLLVLSEYAEGPHDNPTCFFRVDAYRGDKQASFLYYYDFTAEGMQKPIPVADKTRADLGTILEIVCGAQSVAVLQKLVGDGERAPVRASDVIDEMRSLAMLNGMEPFVVDDYARMSGRAGHIDYKECYRLAP